MIYETINDRDVTKWVLSKQSTMAAPPPAWELEPPSETHGRLKTLFETLGQLAEFRRESGAIELHFDRVVNRPTREQMWELSLVVATNLDDDRSFYRWDDLEGEERGAPNDIPRAVVDELWAGAVVGVTQLGPGGRVTLYERQQRSDIVIRRRVRQIAGAWRAPTALLETVNDMVGQEPATDGRLRAALGYFEASKLESQRYLRPVFVFVWERTTAEEGPRWRVATVVAATTLGDLPITAGLESAAGGCP